MSDVTNASKRALLFVNGVADVDALRLLVQAEDFVVAVDGGLRFVKALGLRPDVLIGDLDSVTAEEVADLMQQGVRIERYPVEKDETDLELSLRFVVERGLKVVRILGGLGGRIDQTLGNVFLLLDDAWHGVDVRLEDGVNEVWLIDGEAEIAGQRGDVVSLLPLLGPALGVRTEGLAYPLRGEALYPQRTRGISNRMLMERARVRLEEGVLLCVHTRSVGEIHLNVGGTK
jgi:thiamine pyrophosphokinase